MPHDGVPGATRRAFLHGAVALAVASKVSRAAADVPSAVPEVDALSIQVLVDNATFGPFLPDITAPGLRVERNTGRPAPRMSRHALMAEFGLSLLARSQRGAQSRSVLVDFGYSPEVLANNLAMLGIDTGELDAAVLSHGHLDHYGGFAAVFGGKVPARHLPLIVGGEETFCERVAQIGSPPPVMGTLDRKELAQAGLDVQIRPAPAVLGEHAFTTGLIPLETFERAAIPTQMRPGVGCDKAALAPAKQNQAQLADDGEHELATFYNVKGLGLVVIASCSHRGVLNSVRRAQAISGVRKVHAVVGGFHLVRPRTDDEARRTVEEFVKMDPAYIVPMHCTGEVFIAEALRVMPDKIIRTYVGNRLMFAA
ncbi:MAG TPA: MBL fold metallo-hydrolase [Ramlibacter sp.]|nr:MBL fold metallo-hydrolase [Ramlibacter sp.]